MKTVPCDKCGGKGVLRDQVDLGKNLRKVRLKYGASLRRVADKMGISAPYLSDLELGRRKWSDDLMTNYRNAVAMVMPLDK